MGEGGLLCHHCRRRIEMKRVWAFRRVAEKSGQCSFCLADYKVGVGVGGYYEE